MTDYMLRQLLNLTQLMIKQVLSVSDGLHATTAAESNAADDQTGALCLCAKKGINLTIIIHSNG